MVSNGGIQVPKLSSKQFSIEKYNLWDLLSFRYRSYDTQQQMMEETKNAKPNIENV